MVIVDTKYGAAVLDWRGYHRMDKEKLYRRLYGSFAERPGKTEGGTAELRGEDNTHKEAGNGGTYRG
jgi:N-acetyl-gamma-glutamylphosphate reductase